MPSRDKIERRRLLKWRVADDIIGMPPCSSIRLYGATRSARQANEDYDELMRLDPDVKCASEGLRSVRVGLDGSDVGVRK
ncbi:MAG: hypothetical protein OXI33_06305 [Chloroflexota bacterium]|nr:hypothetical protein [Chloroflexota bacterium]